MADGAERKGVDVNEWARQQAEKTKDANAKAVVAAGVPGQGGHPASPH